MGFGLVCLLLAPCVLGQEPHFANLGDFKLESGDTIQDCHIGFRTFGKLNDERSNAILFLTCFGCTSEDMAAVVAHLRLEKYYVIVEFDTVIQLRARLMPKRRYFATEVAQEQVRFA